MGKGIEKVKARMLENKRRSYGGQLLYNEFVVPVVQSDGVTVYVFDKIANNRQNAHLRAYLKGQKLFRHGKKDIKGVLYPNYYNVIEVLI